MNNYNASNSNLLYIKYPHIFSQIHPTLNPDINPITLTYGCKKRLWWLCPINPCGCHIYQTSVNSKTSRNTSCPFCISIKTCVHNSFMNNSLLFSEFCYELNPGINPLIIPPFSNQKITWKCSQHKTCNIHIWRSSVAERSKGLGCPFCSNHSGSVCQCNSFMNNPLLALEFDYTINNGINPWQISSGSNQEIIWRCSQHKTCNMHIWRSSIKNRSSGFGCPFCTNKNGNICECNTFLTNQLLLSDFDYDLNPGVNPYQISNGSNHKINWKCSKCFNIWNCGVKDRIIKDSGCPSCASVKTESKGEKDVENILKKLK